MLLDERVDQGLLLRADDERVERLVAPDHLLQPRDGEAAPFLIREAEPADERRADEVLVVGEVGPVEGGLHGRDADPVGIVGTEGGRVDHGAAVRAELEAVHFVPVVHRLPHRRPARLPVGVADHAGVLLASLDEGGPDLRWVGGILQWVDDEVLDPPCPVVLVDFQVGVEIGSAGYAEVFGVAEFEPVVRDHVAHDVPVRCPVFSVSLPDSAHQEDLRLFGVLVEMVHHAVWRE